MKLEIDIDARDLAFAKVYADSIATTLSCLITQILKDWANSISEQIIDEALQSLPFPFEDIPR